MLALFPQLFVYLFAPIIHYLKESDFQNFRLENGIKLWQGMWDNRAPQAACFTAPVKPKARNLLCAPTPRGSTEIYTTRKLKSDTLKIGTRKMLLLLLSK